MAYTSATVSVVESDEIRVMWAAEQDLVSVLINGGQSLHLLLWPAEFERLRDAIVTLEVPGDIRPLAAGDDF